MFHLALETWWKSYWASPAERLDLAIHAMKQAAFDHGADDEEAFMAAELMRGYHLRWFDEPLLTLYAEHEFDMPLANPVTGRASRTYVLRGKIDGYVFDSRDGRHYLVEHRREHGFLDS